MQLVDESDVFMTNFLPSARRKLGIEPEDKSRAATRGSSTPAAALRGPAVRCPNAAASTG